MEERARVRVDLPALDPDTGEVRPGVALVTIDRPEVLNAIDTHTMTELVRTLEELDADPECRCIVITGAGERAFAAGADVAEMVDGSSASMRAADPFGTWDRIGGVVTPIIAAVRGFALGGGCELALACDMVVAGEDATFGQPEIRLGIMPGIGGTQRLARSVGKARAMELVLTGRRIPAAEAHAIGIVSRLVPAERTVPAALGLAAEIAALSPVAVAAATRMVDAAFEEPLAEGLAHERAAFYDLFDTHDQEEGMRAFLEKRPPVWRGR
jgi:enoyl-CoA hydratase